MPEIDFLEVTVLVEEKTEEGFLGAPGVSYLLKTNQGSVLFDIAFGPEIKDSWEGRASAAPAPNAEEFTLERVAANVNLSATEVATALQKDGFVVPSASATVGQIAEANGVAPQDIYAAITLRFPLANHGLPEK